MPSLLVIDDDHQLTQMLAEYFGDGQFTVHEAHDAEAGLVVLASQVIDLVVLDVMLPVIDGFDCLRQIRKNSPVPVIMLTAQGSDIDRVIGLELGADDYMAKPFNPRELRARIDAVLRRLHQSKNEFVPDKLVIGALSLSPYTLEVWVGNEAMSLTSSEISILEILMRGCNQVVSRNTLSEQVLGKKLGLYDRSIDTHVSNLRRKLGLGQVSGRPSIRNFRARGYMLVPG